MRADFPSQYFCLFTTYYIQQFGIKFSSFLDESPASLMNVDVSTTLDYSDLMFLYGLFAKNVADPPIVKRNKL